MSRVFDFMLLKIGIKRELSCAHTLLQNGVSERKNRHLVESCRAGPCYRPREFKIFLRAIVRDFFSSHSRYYVQLRNLLLNLMSESKVKVLVGRCSF